MGHRRIRIKIIASSAFNLDDIYYGGSFGDPSLLQYLTTAQSTVPDMSSYNTYPTHQSNITNIGGDYLVTLHGDIIIHVHPPASAVSPDRDHASKRGISCDNNFFADCEDLLADDPRASAGESSAHPRAVKLPEVVVRNYPIQIPKH